MSDKVFYQIIADELKFKTMDAALWTQAIATAEGNPDKTEAAYIRLRFIDLKKSSLAQGAVDAKKPQPEIKAPTVELSQLRSALAKKLYSQGKLSLYSTLSLQPDASDEVVATAIADLESRGQLGAGVSDAEFRYAKNTLGDPALREQYDRKLLDSVSNNVPKMTRSSALGNDHAAEDSSRMSIIVTIVVVALGGYFSLGYYREHNNHELQKESLDTLRDVANSTIDSTQADIDIRNQSLRLSEERQRQEEERQNRAMDIRASATDKMIEQQRIEQERRAQAEQQRLKLQQEQAENLRVSREKQYYACLNQQLLSQRGVTNSDAYARCAMYH